MEKNNAEEELNIMERGLRIDQNTLDCQEKKKEGKIKVITVNVHCHVTALLNTGTAYLCDL